MNAARRIPILVIILVWLTALCVPVSTTLLNSPNSSHGIAHDPVPQCRHIWNVSKERQCHYAKRYCADEDDSILSYMSLYYCHLSNAQPLALLILVAWMIFLFSALGIVAGDFLAVNLGSIAQWMNMSDTLAGVTFLALGNGAPDIFSTIAAMNESSNNLALGELIGAAAFITAVVAGSMALMKPFKIDKICFLRDALFLLGTTAFLHYVLDDGHLRMWHCVVLLGIYMAYISVVLVWAWWHSRRTGHATKDLTSTHPTERPGAGPTTEYEPLLSQHRRRRSSVISYVYKDHHAIDKLRATWARIQVPNWVSSAGRLIMLPARVALQVTVPCVKEKPSSTGPSNDTVGVEQSNSKDTENQSWNRWLTVVQCFTAPQMITWFIFKQLSWEISEMLVPSLVCLGCSTILAILILATSSSPRKPRWYKVLCLPGFLVSIVWISSLADEMVGILSLLGFVCDISNAIMGITVFAIGNSIDDWAADMSVARRGHPLMAFGACFGGPLLNILIGTSIGGIQGILRSRSDGHGSGTINLKPNRSLFFVSWSVMLNIVLLFLLLLWTRWRMTRLVGLVLIVLWVVATVVNVVLEARQ